MGDQLLRNYCYGHPKSSVLLLPLGGNGAGWIESAPNKDVNEEFDRHDEEDRDDDNDDDNNEEEGTKIRRRRRGEPNAYWRWA